MSEQAVKPEYARGSKVRYMDNHDRLNVGEVLGIEATWRFGVEPLVVYTLHHPSYYRNRTYASADRILGKAQS